MKISTKAMAWALAAAVGAAAAGCMQANPKSAGYAVRAEVLADDTLDTCLKVDDARLAHSIRVASLHTDYTERGILRAQVSLLNSGSRDINCQYKFLWFDANDIELRPGQGAWRAVTLHGGEEVRVAGSAASTDATGFKLEVRPQKDTRH